VIGSALVKHWGNKAKVFKLYAMPNLATGPNTAKAICHVAEYESADLIVIGTHPRRGMDRLLLGSVTECVMHDADVPVLLVRAKPNKP
jgi:nucleotide-binding universal stress UspA family protein